MGLIFGGFRGGESKTNAESKEGALVLVDKDSSELEFNIALNFDDPGLAGICTPALSTPPDIED